jgi:hypothetical protein
MDALLEAQHFAEQPFVPAFDTELQRRWSVLLARLDVQATLRRVGRVNTYPQLARVLAY